MPLVFKSGLSPRLHQLRVKSRLRQLKAQHLHNQAVWVSLQVYQAQRRIQQTLLSPKTLLSPTTRVLRSPSSLLPQVQSQLSRVHRHSQRLLPSKSTPLSLSLAKKVMDNSRLTSQQPRMKALKKLKRWIHRQRQLVSLPLRTPVNQSRLILKCRSLGSIIRL